MNIHFAGKSYVLDADRLARDVEAVGGETAGRGANGAVVVALTGHTPASVVAQAATLSAQGTYLPLSLRLDATEALRRARTGTLLLATPEGRDLAGVVAQGRPVLHLSRGGKVVGVDRGRPGHLDSLATHTDGVENLNGERERGRSAGAVRLFSSGTTGQARPVDITTSMLAAHRRACRERIQDGPDAVALAALGLHHVGGVALVDRALAQDQTVWLAPPGDTSAIVSGLQHGATHVSFVPTQLGRLLDAWDGPAPSQLRSLLVGGDRASPDVMARACGQGWPAQLTYGLTEATSQVATATVDETRANTESVGRPLPGVEVTVIEGELVVAGPTVAGGRAATGDAGAYRDGHLVVLGRLDDRITTGGEKVDPVRVEQVLHRVQGVLDCMVVGMPDATWGARVVAAVVGGASDEALFAAAKAHLSPAEVPKEFLRLETLPRTENGKPQRALLRRQLRQA